MSGIISAAVVAGAATYMASENASDAADNASATSRQNQLDTNALTKRQYDQTRFDQRSYRQSGIAAQNRLLTLLGLEVPQNQLQLQGPQSVSTEPRYIIQPSTDVYGQPTEIQVENPLFREPVREPVFNQIDRSDGQLSVDRNSPNFGKYARDFSMTDFQQDPGYGFRLREGIKALENSAAARGGLNSGATGKALIRYGQEAASQEFGNAFSRYQTNRTNQLNALQSLTGQSLTSATNTGVAGQRYVDSVANTNNQTTNSINESRAAGSNARTSGYVGIANQITGAVNQYNKNQQDQDIINRLLPRSTSGGGGSPVDYFDY